MTPIDKAVKWAVEIAGDDTHQYSQAVRWGTHYDCSSFVISAYEQAGVPVKTNGATYTGDMKAVFLNCGFEDVTASVNLSDGTGLKTGDVLINESGRGTSGNGHAALVQHDGGTTVEARSTAYGIVSDLAYRNYPWDCVLRYPGGSSEAYTANWVEREVPNIGKSLATKAYMAYQLYTNKEAGGYSLLWGNNASTADGGLRKYKDFICMAFGSYYGADGTFLKIEFDDGKIIYAVKADEKKDSETDSSHMYHDYPFDRNVTEFVVDQNVVTGNDAFTSALESVGISRSARVTRIWTSDTEPTAGDLGTASSEEKEYHFADTNEKLPIHPRIFAQIPIVPTGDLYVLANGHDISRYVCDISWTNTRRSLATVFNFSVPKADGMKYINMYTPKEGDIFRYSGAKGEYFRGIITEIDDGDAKNNKYVAVDAGWYLNECSDTYQFTNMRADKCLKKICNDLHIPIVQICELSTLITQVYVDKPISDVINDVLSKCGDIYNFDFVPEGIRFYKCIDMQAEPKFRISSNTELKDSVKFMGDISHKKSLDGMRNSVKVITDTDVIITMKDDSSIDEYGFLQEVVKINDGENAETVARNNLDELNKIAESGGGEIIEELDSYTRAGYTIHIGEAQYIIKSSQHSIKKDVHYNKIDLERVIT